MMENDGEKPEDTFKLPTSLPSKSNPTSQASFTSSSQPSTSKSESETPKSLELKYQPPEWGGVYYPKELNDGLTSFYSLSEIKNGVICGEHALDSKSFFVIGRIPTNDLIMDHSSVSRQHAILQVRASDGQLFLYDLNSTHGTRVNKSKIKGKSFVNVKRGDQIKFGESTRVFVVENGPELSIDEREQLENVKKAENDLRSRINAQKMEQLIQKSKEMRKKDEEERSESNSKSEKEEVEKKLTEEEEEELNGDWSETTKVHSIQQGEEEDDGNDDDYYDRTKAVQKKNQKQAAKTHEELVKERDILKKKLEKLEVISRDLTLETSENSREELDPLDSYMSGLKTKEKDDKKKEIDRQVEVLKKEFEKMERLVKITAPAISLLKSNPTNLSSSSSNAIDSKSQPKPKSSLSPSRGQEKEEYSKSRKREGEEMEEKGEEEVSLSKKQKREKARREKRNEEIKRKKEEEIQEQQEKASKGHSQMIEEPEDFSEVPLGFYN